MSQASKQIVELSPSEKRALLAELLEKKAGGSRSFPQSFAQERLWFLDQLQPGSPVYNICASVRLSGLLGVAALERGLNEVVRRHEALRTTFATVGGRPVQVVASSLPLPLPLVDLGGLPEAEREAGAAIYRLLAAAAEALRGPR